MTILSFIGPTVAGAFRNRHDQGVSGRPAELRGYPVSLPARAATLVVAFLAVVAGVIFVAFEFIGAQPSVENYASYAKAGQVNITLMTAPQTTVTDKPDWVSYFIKNPATGNFDHTTYFEVPAGTRVNVTILGYDGCTPLRNPLWGKVAGTTDDARAGLRLVGGLLGAAHVRDPRPRHQRAGCLADHGQREQQSVRYLAVH